MSIEQLNNHHKSKTQMNKYKCEKTNKEITYQSYLYDDETTPLIIKAIIELNERISSLEKALKENLDVIPLNTSSSISQKKKQPLKIT